MLLRGQWTHTVPVTLILDDAVKYGTSRARPHVRFRVEIHTLEEIVKFKPRHFQWSFGPTHPERVRFQCVHEALKEWQSSFGNGLLMLPAFQISNVVMTALYFAADEDEANRLVSQALGEMKVINLLAGVEVDTVDPSILADLKELSKVYKDWLQCCIDKGYYQAMRAYFLALQSAYERCAKKVLDKNINGSEALLRRFYKCVFQKCQKQL